MASPELAQTMPGDLLKRRYENSSFAPLGLVLLPFEPTAYEAAKNQLT
jgi:hypothetical protein